jgi:hypothetical protein
MVIVVPFSVKFELGQSCIDLLVHSILKENISWEILDCSSHGHRFYGYHFFGNWRNLLLP